MATLTIPESRRGYKADFEAVVTYSDPEWGLLFVQDKTGAIFIDVHGDPTRRPVGSRVRVEALTEAGGMGPVLTRARVHVLGTGTQPHPLSSDLTRLNRGVADSSLVEAEGVLRPARESWMRTCFQLVDGGQNATVVFPQREASLEKGMIGARVRIRGVAGSRLDARGRRIGVQLFVPSPDYLEVEAPGPSDAALLIQPVRSVNERLAQARFVGQVRVRGLVTWQRPGLFLVDDGSATLRVRAEAASPLIAGRSKVEVTGFPATDLYGLLLIDGHAQMVDKATGPTLAAPRHTTVAELLQRGLTNVPVNMPARLIEQNMTAEEHIFELESGGQRFRATLPRAAKAEELVRLPKNTELEVTGLAQLGRTGTPEAGSLVLLIASPADVVIVEGFGSLTWRRIKTASGALAVFAIATMLWITQLRRTVHKQTAVIRARYEREILLESRYTRLFERNLAAVFSWRPDGVILDCNPAFAKMLGFARRDELIGQNYWDRQVDAAAADPEALRERIAAASLTNRDVVLLRADGSQMCLLENISVIETPDGTLYETIAIDVTQLRQNQADLQKAKEAAEYQAMNDPLTGLPNRRLLSDRLSHMLATARREDHQVALLYIDLDGFKLVNDNFGHALGDALLVQVAARLQARVRESDTLARLGGDEFIVVLADVPSRRELTMVTDDILRVMTEPFSIAEHEFLIGASIGISIYPADAADPAELLQRADSAMYAAKREGKNRACYFTSDLGFTLRERLNLEHQLRRALARNEISVHYQPEFDVQSGQLVRFEALARWTHPTLGAIPPAKFIPIAEESGLITVLGAFVLEQACREAALWQTAAEPIQLAVNVSSIQFCRASFMAEVLDTLARTGLSPALLQLELTESVMMTNNQHAQENMQLMRAAGISLAIDDFGTGYSSLSALQFSPFDALKIDRSFVKDLGVKPGGEAMVHSVVSLAHRLGMRVIVEGVESAGQLALIKDLGGDEVQGYYLGYPTASPRDLLTSGTLAVPRVMAAEG